jgi:hypothetical protein
MYGVYQELNKENIYKKITSFNIFRRYCPGFEAFGKKFKSPLRDNDRNPSACIIPYKGDLYFKDFGSDGYRAVDFVMEYYQLSFQQALEKINYDFNLGLGHVDYVFKPVTPHIEHIDDSELKDKSTTIIKIKRRPFTDDDINYWYGNYMISEDTLLKFGVSAISNFSINTYTYFSHKLSYSYDYYWEDGIFRRKIYQPLSPDKWFSNGGAIVQGEGMLPKSGDLLIITSSLKDVMALYEMGYTAIAPTTESSFVPESYYLKQNGRFTRIILFMDSDDAGIDANKRLSEKWGLEYILIPEQYSSKDISDLIKNYGQQIAIKLLYEKCMVSS